MYGTYQRYMMETRHSNKYYEEKAAAEKLHALLFPPCPKCGRDCKEAARLVNGTLVYYKCTKAGCAGAVRKEAVNG